MSSFAPAGSTLYIEAYTTASTNTITDSRASTLQVVNLGTEVVYLTVGTTALPAATPTVPASDGDTSLGFPVMPNQPVYLSVAGWQSGDIFINTIVGTGTAAVLATPVISIGDQTNVY